MSKKLEFQGSLAMKTKVLTFLSLAAILCGLVLTFEIQDIKANLKNIAVPDDYPTIKAAVGNATAGDTVFVRKGTYQEFIEIKKPLSLIGEDRSNTIIKGVGDIYGQSPPIITVDAPNVTVSGFTLTYCDNKGVEIMPAAINCTVQDNIITDTDQGVRTYEREGYYGIGIIYSTGILISGNYIANNSGFGIYCSSANTTISENTLVFNGAAGLIIDSAHNVTVSGNNIKGNGQPEGEPRMRIYGGIYLRWDGPFFIYGNNITENLGYGIQFGEGCYNSSVYQNNIELNEIGIKLLNYALSENLTFGQGNVVYQNNIISNSMQVLVEKELDSWNPDFPSINGTDSVFWDNGTVGNYWSDYLTKYPNASEVDSSGIGKTAYVIDSNNIDQHPFMKPVVISEFPSWIVLSIFAIAAFLAAVIVKRKKKSSLIQSSPTIM